MNAKQTKAFKTLANGIVYASLILTSFAANKAFAGDVNENGRRAEIVVDADSGRVLYESNATLLRHPASITKVMTLYLLFDAIESGQLSLDDNITFSRNADAQPRTDLGVRAGQSISVETAILAIICRSANDVAVAVAEKLGGSEAQFARMMTQKAHNLGMNDTNFVNASGLPNRNQISTAEDIAKLAIAIRRDFPRQYHWFSTASFVYNGQEIRNHNHLVGVVDGVDGLKTGFTSSSGYNLAATATRQGHRIVTVVMGGTNWRERDARVASLIDTAYNNMGVSQFANNYNGVYSANYGDERDEIDAQTLVSSTPQNNEATSSIITQWAANGRAIVMNDANLQVQNVQMARNEAPFVVKVAENNSDNPVSNNIVNEPMPNFVVASNHLVSSDNSSEIITNLVDKLPTAQTEEDAETETANVVLAKQDEEQTSQPTDVQTTNILLAMNEVEAKASNEETINPEILAMREAAQLRERQRIAQIEADEARDRAHQDQLRQERQRQEAEELRLARQERARQERALAVLEENHRQQTSRNSRGNTIVQVGAFRARGQAQDMVASLRDKFPEVAKAEVSSVTIDTGTWFRARFTGMAASAAQDACRSIVRTGTTCQIISR